MTRVIYQDAAASDIGALAAARAALAQG